MLFARAKGSRGGALIEQRRDTDDCQVDRCSRHVCKLDPLPDATILRRSCGGEWFKDRGGARRHRHSGSSISHLSIIPVFILLPRFSHDCALRRRDRCSSLGVACCRARGFTHGNRKHVGSDISAQELQAWAIKNWHSFICSLN
jgi:hypothetical protein